MKSSPQLGFKPILLLVSPSSRKRTLWHQVHNNTHLTKELTTYIELMQTIATLKPDLLFLDLVLPGLRGIKTLSRLHGLSPATKILVFGTATDQQEAVSAIKAGAKGHLGRDVGLVTLKKAVQAVQDGQIWAGRLVISKVIEEAVYPTRRRQKDCPPEKSDGGREQLTLRQWQIAEMIGSGAANKDIARALDISEAGVKSHLTAIFRKLNLSSRVELALSFQAGSHRRI